MKILEQLQGLLKKAYLGKRFTKKKVDFNLDSIYETNFVVRDIEFYPGIICLCEEALLAGKCYRGECEWLLLHEAITIADKKIYEDASCSSFKETYILSEDKL